MPWGPNATSFPLSPAGNSTCCRVSIQSRAWTLTSARWSLPRLGTWQVMSTHVALSQS